MITKLLFIERKSSAAVSIEKVFKQVAKSLSKEKYTVDFQQLEYSNDVFGTIKNLFLFRRLKADIYHVTGHVHYICLILPRDKTILTIHDVGILHIRSGLRRFILKKLLFDLPVKKLKFITVVSEATKRDILQYTNCLEEKIRVIENPLQEQFYATTKKAFDKNFPIILQIGTTANKNLPRLIEAIEGIHCQLTIVGELDVETANLLKAKKVIYKNKFRLNDEEIKREYANADILTFCSTFEGFGLPIIEAQAMLTPVVTSNISPLKEVAGAGAALAEPENPDSIKNCILRIISDEVYRREIVTSGVENVKRYKSKNIAASYENLYREVISGLD